MSSMLSTTVVLLFVMRVRRSLCSSFLSLQTHRPSTPCTRRTDMPTAVQVLSRLRVCPRVTKPPALFRLPPDMAPRL